MLITNYAKEFKFNHNRKVYGILISMHHLEKTYL